MTPSQKISNFKIITGAIVVLILFVLETNAYDLYSEIRQKPGMGVYNLNDSINRSNQAFAKLNPFGFTDRPRTTAKPKGTYRIAVLGDSFVWGSGLPYEQVWSHKLEQKILAEHDSIEVMSWGMSGWSTLDEFNFFKQHGKDYDIDMLIIGWVDNDPDLGNFKQVSEGDPHKAYPIVSRIYPALAQRWVNEDQGIVYGAWMDSLYTRGNLNAYQALIDTMKVYFDSRQVSVLYVLTPGPDSSGEEKNYQAGADLFARCGVQYLNLYTSSFNNLRSYTSEQLMANSVNGHPGAIMTEDFATEVLAYLKANKSGIFSRERDSNNSSQAIVSAP